MKNEAACSSIKFHEDALFMSISQIADCVKWPSNERKIVNKALDAANSLQQIVSDQRHHIEHLQHLSTCDQLTGILNRRGFESELEHVLERARRYGEQGAIIYIDLDHFKQVNDTYGHPAGDAVLSEVASILGEGVRGTDYVARLGGDEFVVLLVNATKGQVHNRARLLEQELNHAHVQWMGNTLPISASTGVQLYNKSNCDKELLEKADAAMYEQKQKRHAHNPEPSVTSLRDYRFNTARVRA